jgi:hypothetical protein
MFCSLLQYKLTMTLNSLCYKIVLMYNKNNTHPYKMYSAHTFSIETNTIFWQSQPHYGMFSKFENFFQIHVLGINTMLIQQFLYISHSIYVFSPKRKQHPPTSNCTIVKNKIFASNITSEKNDSTSELLAKHDCRQQCH